MPFLLLAATVMAPVWINDHRLARMVDRIHEYPLPPGTDFGVVAWTPFDEPGTPVDGTSATKPVIIDLGGMYDDTWMDMRCW
ncbi:hypothetical protein ACIBI9_65085 [Nonomuraea sp. NPDC050451]|uniref:hypothetical protein n=1 Tax=Nonomuraea sp. NPDC050451 TaxID=3364364 RepID=UPI00378BEB09